MAAFLELLLLQIVTGHAYTFPGGNLGQDAQQPSSPPPSPLPPPHEQRICRDDRVAGLIKLVKSQHEEQMELLRTLARCQCSGQENHAEYQEYIHQEDPYEEVPEFPVPAPYDKLPAPYEVPAPYELPASYEAPAPYEVPSPYEVLSSYEIPSPPPFPTFPVATYSEPSEVPTAKKYKTQSTTHVYSTTAPPPTRSRYQGPTTATSPPPVPTMISPPVPTAKKYQTQTTTQAFTTTAPPPATRSRYQSSPTTTIAAPAPTARKYQTQPTTTTTAVPPPTRSSYQSPPTATTAPPVPTAQRYQAPSPDDLIPEEYDESRSFSVFPECDGDCPIIPDANTVPQLSSYEHVSTSYETEPSTTEYKEPPPVPEQGSGPGNYRTNIRGGVSSVPQLPDEDLEEIVKELEKSYPPNYLPGYEQSYGGAI